MTLDQILEIVLENFHPEAWLVNDERGILTLKKDLDIRLRENRSVRRPFTEPWTQRYPDKTAYLSEYQLWYRSSLVKTYPMVWVDGWRAGLPLPKSVTDLSVTREQAAISSIVNYSLCRSYYLDYIKHLTLRTTPDSDDAASPSVVH